ncbi:hypothetical protein BJ138DRAFT_1134028 [Hygrophoropsis aurantiaca]|uniref:Uncharacterized protein n=1 Tax=Hygrophoropsis aurantiaca TaxID=72124 RepID=A0ACB8AKT5_9AGAM|nr:hypothetical protein BJ138DRAFT_1134028 [Hygrophoropsis aurantiaca]
MAFTNTGGTSLFGQTKPAGSLFGNTQPSTTTGFGGFGGQQSAQPTQQTGQGTSLFGGGLGQNTQNQPQSQASAGPFGQPAPNTQQQGSTGLFGQPAANTQQQSTPGIFGQSTQQPPQQNAFGTSMFGNTSTANTAGQQQSGLGSFGGTFGSNATQQQSQPATGLFGSTNTSQQQPTAGFGQGAGSSLFPPSRQQSISPMQSNGPVLFSKSTKFNDLPEDAKKTFTTIDTHIQGRIQISTELKQRKLGQEAIQGQELGREIHKELLNVASVVQSDKLCAVDLKMKTDQAVQDIIVATHIVDGFKNPQQSGAYLKNHADFPLEFFTRVTQQMRERLQWYKNTIEQIERKLSSSTSQSQSTPQAISATLQSQHAIFLSLASKTATLDAEMQKVKTLYTQLWRAKTGSMRDPFSDLDRGSGGDFGLESLRVT